MAFSGIVATQAMTHQIGMYPAILLGIFVGGVGGWINGVLIARAHLPPFIATLGTMGIARGLARFSDNPGSAHCFDDSGHLGTHFAGTYTLWPLHLRHRWKRRSTRLSDPPVGRYLIWIYTLAGFWYGVAGIILASRLCIGQPTVETGYEPDVITAWVVGGASLSGGEGQILSAMVGALITGVVRNGSNLLDVSAFWKQVLMSSIIIAAVFAERYRRQKHDF